MPTTHNAIDRSRTVEKRRSTRSVAVRTELNTARKPPTRRVVPSSSKSQTKPPKRHVILPSYKDDKSETEHAIESEVESQAGSIVESEVESETESETESEVESEVESESEPEIEVPKKARRPTAIKKRKIVLSSRPVAKNKPTTSGNRTIHR